MAGVKEKKFDTVIQAMEKVTTPPIARFIKYMYTPEDQRKPWKEFRTCHEYLKNKTYDECLPWLERADAQKAMQVYRKYNKLYDLTRLYDSMYEKALAGDVRAASWIESFMQSSYFDESQDEIDEFLDGIDIPALKGS